MSTWWAVVIALVAGMLLVWTALLVALWLGRPDQLTVRDALRLLPDVVRLLRRLAVDRTLPRGVRVRLWLLLAYLLLPFDLVPDFIPVLGYADDAIVVAFALRSVTRRAGPEALSRHWPGTPDGLAAVRRLARLDIVLEDRTEARSHGMRPDDRGIMAPLARGPEELTASLNQALAAGTREALTALTTEDVGWHGERRDTAHECLGRDQVGDHYAGLLAAGIRLQVAELTTNPTGDDDSYLALIQVRSPDPDDFPSRMDVRLTLRDGLIRDICILDPPVEPVAEALVGAIRTGDLPALRGLLADHPDLAAARLGNGRTFLHVTTDWPGHLPDVAATIDALVGAGADPDAPFAGEHAETPLHWAASSNDVAAIDALLDHGADIDAPGAVIAGGTPMADATAFGQWEAARRLLDRGAQTNLFEAATLGLVAVVEEHLADGPSTAETITSGFWGACHGGQRATAALLLDRGADLNWTGYDGLTPLDAARRSGAEALVVWLTERGARSAAPPQEESMVSPACSRCRRARPRGPRGRRRRR